MVHFDGVEWAELRAETTIHTNISVDIEFGWLRLWTTGGGVYRSHDPNTLWRASLGANTAGGAADILLAIFAFIIHKERREAEFFWNIQLLFGILDGEGTFGIFARSKIYFSVAFDEPTNIFRI